MIKIENYNNITPSFDGEAKRLAPRRLRLRYFGFRAKKECKQ